MKNISVIAYHKHFPFLNSRVCCAYNGHTRVAAAEATARIFICWESIVTHLVLSATTKQNTFSSQH